MTDPIVGFINDIIQKVKTVTTAITNIPSPKAALSGIFENTIGRIPFLAEGGIVTRPTLAHIGEREPEAVIPLSQLGRYGGGGGGGGKKTYAIMLDGEKLGEFIINRVNQGSRNGELDLVGA